MIPDKYIERVEDAAREGNSTVFMTGVDPGFATDLLPFALAGTCQSIEQVRTMEIADYATYDGATVMFDVMGFGNQIGDFPMLFQPGVLSIAWGTAIRQLAAGLGIEVDEIRDSVEQEPAPEDFDIAAGHIAKGTVAALRFQIEGMVKGKPVIVVEHVTRLRGDLRPDWAQPAQPGGSYRVEIIGEPSLRHGHLPDEPQRRPQLRGHPRGGRPDRERHPRRCRGAARHPDHARYAAGHRAGSVRSYVGLSAMSAQPPAADPIAEIGASTPGPQVGAFFDLDGTLVDGFTATAHAGDRIRRRQARIGEVVGVIEASMRYRLGRMRFEHLLTRAAGYLRGESLAELDELGERLFVERVCLARLPRDARDRAAHQQRGHTVVLSSSALTIHAEPVARYLGIDHVLCNHFELDDQGLLTGRIAKPVVWGRKKADRGAAVLRRQ